MKRQLLFGLLALFLALAIGLSVASPPVADACTVVCGQTIGFWGANAAKDLDLIRGKAQVDKPTYLSVLDCVDTSYGPDIVDWVEWHISSPAGDMELEWALHWLRYGAYEPGTGWTKPNASDPQVKARGQLLALLLTACHKGSDYTDAWARVPKYGGWMTVSQWIDDTINHYNLGHYDIAYDVANHLNEHCALLLR